MTLFDCSCRRGIVTGVEDDEVGRRLVDLGLIGSTFAVSARRGGGILVRFEHGVGAFSAVLDNSVARTITVVAIER